MNPYFVFSDESGNYEQIRDAKFHCRDPFYVRSTIIISLEDYIALQKGITSIKDKFDLPPQTEVNWSHYGSAIKNNYKKIPHTLTPLQLEDYYRQCLALLDSLDSVSIYYTFTENKSVGRIDKLKLIKMHLQNAYQRVQAVMSSKDGYAI